MADQMFVRIGRNVHQYMSVNCHPSAIVKWRVDGLNNEKMQQYGQLSQPFSLEDVGGSLDECSDPHCAGVFVRAGDESEWQVHLRYAHGDGPSSRVGKLQATKSAQQAALDQAVEAGKDAIASATDLEGQMAGVNKELESITSPKPVKSKVSV